MKIWILTAGLLVAAPLGAQENGSIQEMPAGHEQLMSEAVVSEPGQGAFAAIGEIIAALDADPETVWSQVDIDALRVHLVDMDMVMTYARVTRSETDFGMRFVVNGEGDVVGSIQRMVVAHASVMEGVEGWSYMAEATPTGAILEVSVPALDIARLRAIGFFGILTSGMHHQSHHWMMATGMSPHH